MCAFVKQPWDAGSLGMKYYLSLDNLDDTLSGTMTNSAAKDPDFRSSFRPSSVDPEYVLEGVSFLWG